MRTVTVVARIPFHTFPRGVPVTVDATDDILAAISKGRLHVVGEPAPATPTPRDTANYESMTVAELRDHATRLDVTIPSGSRKTDIITLLEQLEQVSR